MADLTAPDLALVAAGDEDASRPVVTLAGREFRVADRIGGMAVFKFAKMASRGVDSESLEGMAAMYDLLRAVVARDEWDAFEAHAEAENVSGDDLMAAVFDGMEALAERPTSRPSVSSGGPQRTSTNSAGDSSSRAIAALEAQGRPELALLVSQARAS